jgi:hypothetical protein
MNTHSYYFALVPAGDNLSPIVRTHVTAEALDDAVVVFSGPLRR